MHHHKHTTHHIFYNYQMLNQRRLQLKKAIERSTGISMNMLEVIEQGMEERKNHPLLRAALENHNKLPSSQKIMARLLSAPMQKSSLQANNLFTEYRVSLRSSRTQIEIVAVMRLFRKKSLLLAARAHGIITVRYIISRGDQIHEYRQDFLLSHRRFVTTKHSALDYGHNTPAQLRERLTPKLIAPPRTIYV